MIAATTASASPTSAGSANQRSVSSATDSGPKVSPKRLMQR